MSWEIMERRRGRNCNRTPWWHDSNSPGVSATRNGIVFNKAMQDILKVDEGSLILILIDKQNNAFGFRSPQEGEEAGACSMVKKIKASKFLSISSKNLIAAFPWLKSGVCYRAELMENGNYAMMVVRNKL